MSATQARELTAGLSGQRRFLKGSELRADLMRQTGLVVQEAGKQSVGRHRLKKRAGVLSLETSTLSHSTCMRREEQVADGGSGDREEGAPGKREEPSNRGEKGRTSGPEVSKCQSDKRNFDSRHGVMGVRLQDLWSR